MRMNSGMENRYNLFMGGKVWPCSLNCGDNFDIADDTFLAVAGEVLACFLG